MVDLKRTRPFRFSDVHASAAAWDGQIVQWARALGRKKFLPNI